MLSDPLRIALIVAEALEGCGIRYLVGGSLASSISGEPRSTLDVHLVVELTQAGVEPLIAALGDTFYADAEALPRAARERSSATLIHLPTSTRVDLFVAGGSPIDLEQMNRRQRVTVATDPDRHLYVHTPEDIPLQKLRWCRLGNEVSDRQWRDILGIVLVQEGRLDESHLRRGAEIPEVAELLARALSQVRGR